MKKWVFGIMIFMSVFFMIGISKVNAENQYPFPSYPDIDTINLSGIENLNYATPYYVVGYSSHLSNLNSGTPDQPALYLIFFRSDAGYIELSDNYDNDICTTYTSTGTNGCFFRIWGFRNGTTNVKLSAVYYSFDNGNTWIYNNGSHDFYNKATYSSYIIKSTTWIRPYQGAWVDLYTNQFELDLPNLFDITYEQGEVIMSDYNNQLANLITMYIETYENPMNYTFGYSYNLSGAFRESDIFEPVCSESLVNNNIHYSCYYNLPIFFNTTINFSIVDNSIDEEVYNYDLNAYISSLSSTSDYDIYSIKGYSYGNISYVSSGTFAVPNYMTEFWLKHIYVTNITTNNKEELEDTNFYTGSYVDNDYLYVSFDFNNSLDYYITLDFYNWEFWIDSVKDLYLYAPSGSYVHLSGTPDTYEEQQKFQNQQSYKDPQGNIVNVDNQISYSDNATYFKEVNNVLDYNLPILKGLASDFTTFINSLNQPIRMAFFFSFAMFFTYVIIRVIKNGGV